MSLKQFLINLGASVTIFASVMLWAVLAIDALELDTTGECKNCLILSGK